MRMIILATLTTGSLLSGTALAFAECQTLAQARASNPNSHLAYQIVAGTHCWFAGLPRHRDLAAAKKQRSQLVATVKSDEQPPAQAPADLQKTPKPGTVGLFPDRPQNGQYERRIAEAFDAIQFDKKLIDRQRSLQGHQFQPLSLYTTNVEIYATKPAQSPRQRGPPAISEVRYLTPIVWVLLTIGIAVIITGILNLIGHRLSAQPARQPGSRQEAQRLRVREYPSASTPLVNYVHMRILDRGVSSSDRRSRSPRRQRLPTGWIISSLMRRTA